MNHRDSEVSNDANIFSFGLKLGDVSKNTQLLVHFLFQNNLNRNKIENDKGLAAQNISEFYKSYENEMLWLRGIQWC
jgi:hypothetical protein